MRRIRAKQDLCSFMSLVCFCLCLNGCGNRQKYPDGMPAPQPTIITVIQDGQPLEGASIAFLPSESSNSWNAGGITDVTGNASIKTLSKYEGVVPGKYRILITKRISDASKLSAPDPATDPQGYAKYMQESSKEKIAGYDLIDPKFSKISGDTEQIEIVTGKNEKTIDVGKAVRVKRQ